MKPRLVGALVVVAALGVSTSADAATKVRVAHLSPDAPAVDVIVDGSVVLSGVEFPAVSPYLPLTAGSHRIQVTPAGDSDTVVIDATVELERDTAYTVAATGFLAENDLKPLVLVDDVEADPAVATVRFTHTSPDAPAVDVAVVSGDVIFGDVSFRGSAAPIQVPEGTYDLEVRLAGTSTVVLPLPGIALEAGVNYDVFAIGSVAAETLAALPVVTAETSTSPARVRVAHLSPDAPNVDVWVNGSVVLADVPFQAVSGYLALDAGEYNVQVTPAGADMPVVINADLELAAGVSYTVAATGLLGSGDLRPVVLVDDRSFDVERARVRFVHTSPDAPAVDVAVTGGPVLFPDVSFRESGDYLAVDPATYDLEVRVAGTNTVALPVPGVTLEAGVVVTVFAVGLAGDGSLAALPAIDRNERFLRADSNRDNSVNIGDPIATLGFLFTNAPEVFCPDAADANDDGHVNLTDAVYTLEYLFLRGSRPASPFPTTGVDTSDDTLVCEE